MTQLGLDMDEKNCEKFLEGRRPDSLSFMLFFARELLRSITSGEKVFTVRNWFPGSWYFRDRIGNGPSVLHLYLESCRGRWTDMGKVRASPAPCCALALMTSRRSCLRRQGKAGRPCCSLYAPSSTARSTCVQAAHMC